MLPLDLPMPVPTLFAHIPLPGCRCSELEERVEELDGAEAREAEEELVSVRKRMSAVMAAMAKVYLTDMFEEPEAAAECEQLLDKALRFDSENPEACQALADLRLTQGRQGEALLLARRTAEICARLPGGLVPTYDFRVVTARLLVELSAYSDAVGILEGLTGEDPEDTEAWYLLGMCRMMLHRPREARDALLTARALLEENPARNGALMSQINQLLARRVLSEQEREGFWNPRGWLGGAKGVSAMHSRYARGLVPWRGVPAVGRWEMSVPNGHSE